MVVGQVPGQGHVGHRPGRVLELDDEVSLHVWDISTNDASPTIVDLDVVWNSDGKTCDLFNIESEGCDGDVLCTLQCVAIVLPTGHDDIHSILPEIQIIRTFLLPSVVFSQPLYERAAMADPGLGEVAEVRPEVGCDVETEYPGRVPLCHRGAAHHHQTVSVLEHAVAGQGQWHAGHLGPGLAVERIVGLHRVHYRHSLGITSTHIEVTQGTDARSLNSNQGLM